MELEKQKMRVNLFFYCRQFRVNLFLLWIIYGQKLKKKTKRNRKYVSVDNKSIIGFQPWRGAYEVHDVVVGGIVGVAEIVVLADYVHVSLWHLDTLDL